MMRWPRRWSMAAARRSRACAEPGYERALAAALGEDADAAIGEATIRAVGRERAACRAIRPFLPGRDCLADHVRAPTELARRLRQIAVADADRGQTLAVGQRLVTRDGVMRRWDGFVTKGAGAAAAERLLRANRLAQLADELPALEQRSMQPSPSGTRRSNNGTCRAQAEEAGTRRSQRSAMHAKRRGRSMPLPRRSSASRRSAALEQRQPDLEPVLEAAREAMTRAERSLARTPRSGSAGA